MVEAQYILQYSSNSVSLYSPLYIFDICCSTFTVLFILLAYVNLVVGNLVVSVGRLSTELLLVVL